MVTEFFLGLVVTMGEFLIGLMPPDESGQMVATASGALAGVVSLGSGVSVWIPWAVAGVAGAFVFTSWALLFAVKILRQLIAHIPQFGGTG